MHALQTIVLHLSETVTDFQIIIFIIYHFDSKQASKQSKYSIVFGFYSNVFTFIQRDMAVRLVYSFASLSLFENEIIIVRIFQFKSSLYRSFCHTLVIIVYLFSLSQLKVSLENMKLLTILSQLLPHLSLSPSRLNGISHSIQVVSFIYSIFNKYFIKYH